MRGMSPTQVAGELPAPAGPIVPWDAWYNSYSGDALSAVQIYLRAK